MGTRAPYYYCSMMLSQDLKSIGAQLSSKAVLLLVERIAAAAARYNNNTRLGASLGNVLSQLPQSIQLLIYNKLINTNLEWLLHYTPPFQACYPMVSQL